MRILLVTLATLLLVGAGSCGDEGEAEVEPREPTPAVKEATPAPEATRPASLLGSAENAKGGAVIVEDGGRVVYVAGLDSWPDEVHGKAVRAEGTLVERQYLPVATVAPDGAISQGTAGGDQWVLEDAEWAVARTKAEEE